MKKLLISTVVSLCLYNVAYAEDNAQVCYNNKNIPCLERLANAGDIWMYSVLGYMYLKGEGTTRNYTKAYYWTKKAANKSDAWAQGVLGYMYLKGQGTTRNYKKAYYWTKKSANQDEPYAQGTLGYMYANGLGTTYDYKKAYIWSLIAQSNSQELSEEAKKIVEGNIKFYEMQLTKQQITQAQEEAEKLKSVIENTGE